MSGKMRDDSSTKTVLIFDDSDVVLDISRRFLEEAGYSVATAMTLEDFNRVLEGGQPDLILLDVQMPEVDGDKLSDQLRKERDIKSRIVLFSTLDDDELRARATSPAIDGFISKNEGLEAMVAYVSHLLES
jgi:CheY-like chemotaxis protein